MPLLRRLGLLCATGVGAAVLAGPVLAARPTIGPGNLLPYSLGTTHFLVHYASDLATPTFAITQTQAGDIAARAERAYAAELADGYPAPPGDAGLGGDARLDIYVVDLTAAKVLGLAIGDAGTPQTSSYVELNGATPETAFDQHTIAHELFHQIQFGVWQPPLVTDAWLVEGSAEWMGYRVDAYGNTHPFAFGPNDMSLDCRDPNPTNQCDPSDTYFNNGYSRWPFFEYVIEKYGASFVKDIFAQGAGGAGSAIASVQAALVAKGSTLADTYNAWALAELTSAYSVSPLQAVKPAPYGAAIPTGTKTGTVTSQKVAVNHLSTRFLKFTRGAGGAPASTCYKATLTVTVTIPAGTLSQPVFYWDAPGSSAVPLTIVGSTATGSVPWDTCSWSGAEGFLSLPNASQAVDAADFGVTVALNVDASTAVTAAPPPPPLPAVVTSPVIPVSSADAPPTIAVFGPQLLRLSATASRIRLIVDASGQGLLSASLGSLALGTVSLRAGNNDLRFAVPKGTLLALRRSAAASNMLTLTPVSASGVSGTPVTRTVRITPAKKSSRRK